MRVLVAGALHLDVVLRAPHLPARDETVAGQSVAYVFGGKGGNQALAASRMGADVVFAGRAGSDGFGDMLRATLEASDIDLSLLQRDPGPSGMSAAILEPGGDYGAVIVSGANLNIDAGVIDMPADVGLVVLQNEIPAPVNLALARKARAVGARLWLNAAPARALEDELVALVDLLIVNRVEAAFYGEAISRRSLQTRGSDGVVWQDQHHAAPRITPHSSHGAGDMFVGALAAEVARGASIDAALPVAQAAAALHVMSEPTARAALDRATIMAFAAAQPRR